MKVRTATIHNPIYGYDIYLHFGGNTQEAEKVFWSGSKWELLITPDKYRPVGAVITYDGMRSHSIYFSSLRPNINTITHEAMHSAFFILRILQAQADKNVISDYNEETYTYLGGWTAQEIYNVSRKRKNENESN